MTNRKEYTQFLFDQYHALQELITAKEHMNLETYDLDKQKTNLTDRITIQLDLIEVEIPTALDQATNKEHEEAIA